MRKIQILIVDDAVVIRQLLTKLLSSDPALEVIGVAANGRIALTKIPQVNPDLIILDIEMPEMNGLETLAAIRKTYPQLPVIMFSSLTERGAAVTLEALSLGANDYVVKPAGFGAMDAALDYVRAELIPRIKTFCRRTVIQTRDISNDPPSSLARARISVKAPPEDQRVDILAIGVSTGGPAALAALLSQLPGHFPVPIVIVQHMPPIFTQHLAIRLTSCSALKVSEGIAGEMLLPSQVWLAPGGFHMTLKRVGTVVQLESNQDPPENSCRPSVDVLFRSVAEVYSARTLAVMLTGMGQDGLRGCQSVRESGGQILVQDEASSVVWGMPGLVAKAGLADAVLPLQQLAGEIMKRVAVGRKA